jgi:hypothetical protein
MKTIRTVVLALAAAALPAQGEAKPVLDAQLVVRVPEALGVDLTMALYKVLNTTQVASEIVAAVAATAPQATVEPNHGHFVDVSVLVPKQQALVQVKLRALGAPPEAGLVADAARKVVQRHLDRVLFEPAAEECALSVHAAEQVLMEAKKQRDIVREREAELGLDDAAAAQQALFELKQQAMQAELELRTEQAVSEELQKQLAKLEPRFEDAGRVLLEIDQKAAMVDARLRNAGQSETEAASLRQLLEQEQALRRSAAQVYERTGKELEAMQEQVSASALLLQRHLARRAVLMAMVAEHQRVADESAVRARERRDLLREIGRREQIVEQAELQCTAARQRLQSLQPVRVKVGN